MEITPRQLAGRPKNDASLRLVDVRESAEISEGRISGAEQVALDDLMAKSGELSGSRPVVVARHSEPRNAVGAAHLAAADFAACTIRGGMLGWPVDALRVA